MAHLDRVTGVGNRCADQCLFDRPAHLRAVARADVPGGGRDDLVVFDLAVFDLDPVAQRAADGLGGAPAPAVALFGLDVPRVVQFELAQAALGLPVQLDGLVHAANLAQVHAGATHSLEHVEDQRIVVLPGFTVLATGHQLARQRPGLQAAKIGMRHGGRPGILGAEIGVVFLGRPGDAVKRVLVGCAFVIPGVAQVLAGKLLVHQAVGVGHRIVDAALHDHRCVARVDGRLLVFVLVRQIAPAQVFANASAVSIQAHIQAHLPVKAQVGIGMPG